MPQLLDVAIGTIFVFLLFSLVVSALNEYILTLTDQRAKFLRLGLMEMFGKEINQTLQPGTVDVGKAAPGDEGNKLLNHGLIRAFSRSNSLPSYIPAGAFVTGLLDVIVKPRATVPCHAAHMALLTGFIIEIKKARPVTDASYDHVITSFEQACAAPDMPPFAGTALEKLHVRVMAAADKPKFQKELLAAPDFTAAGAVINKFNRLKPELNLMATKAGGHLDALKDSVRQWFTPETELAALEAEATAAVPAFFCSAAQQASITIGTGIQNLPEGQLKQSLQSLFQTVEGDVQKFKLAVEGWFNGVMDRVSGWYKRFAQKWMIFIGFVLAASFNVDTLEIVRVLSNNPNLAKAVANQAEGLAKENKDNRPLTTEELEKKREQQLTAVADASVALDKQKIVTASAADGAERAVKAVEAAKKAGDASAAIQTQTVANQNLSKAQADQKTAEATLAKAMIEADTQAKLKAAVDQLRDTGIPMGWTPEVLKKLGVDRSPEGILSVPEEFQDRVLIGMIGGWLLTAIASSLGAPFWFDLLGRFVNVRASGKAPGEKETTSSPTRPTPANIDTTPGTHPSTR